MAMKIFFLLNGMGIVFLLYVLANFWKEARRQRVAALRHADQTWHKDAADVFVVMHPISHNVYEDLSVAPIQVPEFDQNYKEEYRRFIDEVETIPIKRLEKLKRLSAR